MNLPACLPAWLQERLSCCRLLNVVSHQRRALSRANALPRWVNALPVERALSNTADENAEVNELFVWFLYYSKLDGGVLLSKLCLHSRLRRAISQALPVAQFQNIQPDPDGSLCTMVINSAWNFVSTKNCFAKKCDWWFCPQNIYIKLFYDGLIKSFHLKCVL